MLAVCTKYIKVQQMHFNYIDIILMYYGHQHVSATHVAIVTVISLRTRIQISITQESPKHVGNHNTIKLHQYN
jgi:hypothetical protein